MNIELDSISKRFAGSNEGPEREVLKDISLTVDGGDAIAITGPSGSGKSTLLNIIGTLDMPSSGRVLINNTDVSHLSSDKLAEMRNRSIGFVFQLHHLLPQLNLIENVLIPLIPASAKGRKKEKTEKAMELIRFMGLAERIHQRPGQLSVGECQRTAVVRALINEPELILADEPTGSLDQENADLLGDRLVRINDEFGITLIVVTHSSKLAEKFKTQFFLENGGLQNLRK